MISTKLITKTIFEDNKTKLYLHPIMSCYGKGFRDNVNQLRYKGVRLFDRLLIDENKLYYLLDLSNTPSNVFNSVSSWLYQEKYLAYHYPIGEIFESTDLHMYALHFPSEYKHAIEYFIQSKYSKMYLHKDVDMFFKGDAVGVLKKTPEYRKKFQDILNKQDVYSGTSLITLNEDCELDYMVNKNDLVWNY